MNRHTATHEGFTFTRNSKGRIYSHVVLRIGSIAADRLRAEEHARYDWKVNRSFYAELADGSSRFLDRKPWETEDQHADRVAKERADAAAWLAEGCEGRIARALARFDERAANVATRADGDTYFTVAGWAGRPDLAAKLAGCDGIMVEAVRA